MKAKEVILITGATGFIGSHLAKDLAEKGESIKCLIRRSSPKAATQFLSGLGAELVTGDLTDEKSLEEAVKGVDTVFHLGGGGRMDTPEDVCFRINVDGTRNLLDACSEQGGVKIFIHVSTCGVMGNIKNPPADETHPYQPENMAYARAKTEAEKVALSYKDRLPVTVIRFPLAYGTPLIDGDLSQIEGVTPMSMIFSAVQKGQWVYFGDGMTLIHCIHVDDIVYGLELAAKKGKTGEVYILADEKAVQMNTLVEISARALNVPAPRRHIPLPAAMTMALLMESTARLTRRKPMLTHEVVRGFTATRAFDTSKARRELGFHPQIGLDEGIRATINEYASKGYI
ncbi:MAG: SDR family NAD(P)-dependent oxidoreductase [Chloroflexota bacterium]|nr:SDR family NAD(P)-dependent oxidoreductase [Chloroflexota bacterium]